jgi:hypothetical protein
MLALIWGIIRLTHLVDELGEDMSNSLLKIVFFSEAVMMLILRHTLFLKSLRENKLLVSMLTILYFLE